MSITTSAKGANRFRPELLIEKHARGEAPDLVLTADTSVEKPATYEYLDVIRPWMRDRGIRFELVSYVPKRFKHWPPYYGILEMCLTNATLPSKSLGGSSCSLKYKKAPQDKFLSTWQPAVDAWARGQRVVRLIGYDAGPRDTARANHALSIDDPLYDCEYPLREWRWDRPDCVARIQAEGLPVPPKSAYLEMTVIYGNESNVVRSRYLSDSSLDIILPCARHNGLVREAIVGRNNPLELLVRLVGGRLARDGVAAG